MTVFNTSVGLLKPLKQVLATSTMTTLLTAGANGALVEYWRAALATSSAVTTLQVEIFSSALATTWLLRGPKALAAFEVAVDRDPIMMESGEVLRARVIGDSVTITGMYVDPTD